MQGQGGSPDSEPVNLLFILGNTHFPGWHGLLQMASRLATESGTEWGTRQPPLPGVAWGACMKSSWPDIVQGAGAIKVDLSVSQEGYLLE